MIRRPPPIHCAEKPLDTSPHEWLNHWHQQLMTRRRFLLSAVGGSLTLLFPLSARTKQQQDPARQVQTWTVLAEVLEHLFPEESSTESRDGQVIPGAARLGSVDYLRNTLRDMDRDSALDDGDRTFIPQGVVWLEDLAQQHHQASFTHLDHSQRESLLRQVASSSAGENWIGTLMYYLCESLLTDPVYGGNRDGLGWAWLQHTPGFPRPPEDKTLITLRARRDGRTI